MNNFNTREKFCLNNTFIMSSHSFKTPKFYFIWNFDVLKRFLIILKCLRIAYEQLFNNIILNKYFFKFVQSWRHFHHHWNRFLICSWTRLSRTVLWKQTRSWSSDAWCSEYHIKFRSDDLIEYEYSLKNFLILICLTARCALFMLAYLQAKFVT